MTAQFTDSVEYRGQSYSLAGVNGRGLFNPAKHGLKPVGKCSACWRGSLCGYAVAGGTLRLDSLAVSLDGPPPALFGVPPEPKKGGIQIFDASYQGLDHPVAYTGRLLLAAGFIKDLYVHMGFHPAWKYSEVHELVFHKGRLVTEADRSGEIAELRRKLGDQPLQPGSSASRAAILWWIKQCFSQRYRW